MVIIYEAIYRSICLVHTGSSSGTVVWLQVPQALLMYWLYQYHRAGGNVKSAL